ncbi:putative gustatory receptor 28b isoform X1 [Homalodisca vitripennis]|uniref:putative gustatory receptor 28b isoform X1 n=1 Tax=Homalodisca vitripennis TaxID=197043 RepID=UPI001EEA6B85|nr:putative gustatory receptor 28b isoform X1 [Homalodisca vitripennis]
MTISEKILQNPTFENITGRQAGDGCYCNTKRLLMTYSFYRVILYSTDMSYKLQANKMATVIHDLVTTEKVDDVADELLNFSLAILHTNFHFSAYGFFNVDYTLIFFVISRIVSYLVILIQFQVSSTTLTSTGLMFNITHF